MATEMLEISLDRVGVLDAESNPINRYLQILKDECQRELRLINDLLDLTRLDAGTEPLMLSAIQLQGLIPYIVEPFVARARTQQQHLAIDIPAELPALTEKWGSVRGVRRQPLALDMG